MGKYTHRTLRLYTISVCAFSFLYIVTSHVLGGAVDDARSNVEAYPDIAASSEAWLLHGFLLLIALHLGTLVWAVSADRQGRRTPSWIIACGILGPILLVLWEVVYALTGIRR